MKKELIYLGFVISIQGMNMDTEKVRVILDWSRPTNATEVGNFHGIASFYLKFIRHFSQVCAPLIACIKKGEFKRTKVA